MSRRIRNKKKTSKYIKDVIFLSDLPDSSIIMYPGSGKMYAKTGVETETHFAAICIASDGYNHNSLGKKRLLSKRGAKRARHLNQPHWDFENNYWYESDNPRHHINTDMCHLWLAAVDVKNKNFKTVQCTYDSYSNAVAASKFIKSKYPKPPLYTTSVPGTLDRISKEYRLAEIARRRNEI